MPKKVANKSPAADKSRKELIRALIVDDQTSNLSLFKTILEGNGYRVTTCINGDEALQKLKTEEADLIVSDILMPIMDGFHFLQECRADEWLKDVPFVFLTGAFLDKQDEDLALKLGVDAFIRKPVEPEELLKVLEDVARRRSLPPKKGKKPGEEQELDADRLIQVNLMEKLEKKMAALEEEIAQREQIEEALRQSEAQYRLLYETMAQGVVYQSADGQITSANPAAERILGLTHDQILGRTSSDLRWKAIHEDGSDFSGEEHPAMVALKTGQPVNDAVMGVFNPADDKFHWVNISAVPQFHPGEDKPYKVYTTFEDITDSFLSFKAIQESESRMTAMIENTTDAIWSIDRERRVIAANTASRELYMRVVKAELNIGMDIIVPMPESRKAFWMDILNQAFSGKRMTFEQQYEVKGGYQDIEYSVSPVVTAAGQIIGASCFGRDVSVRNQAARTLKESEEKYRAVVENASEVIVIVQDAIIVFVNHLFDPPVTGFSLEDFYSRQMTEVIHPDDRQKLVERYQRRLQGENFTDAYPMRLVSREGKVAWVELRAALTQWEGKVATLAVLNNITERKDAEDALRQSEEKYRTILEQMDEGYYEVDAQGNYTFFNDAIARKLGYNRDELFGMNYKAYVAREEWHRVVGAFTEVFRTGKPRYWLPITMIKKDGSRVYVEDSVQALRNDKGDIIGLRGISRDITGRKETEDALRESEQRFRSLFEYNPVAVFLQDLNGRFMTVNDAYCKLTGYSREELLALDWRKLCRPEDVKTARANFIKATQGQPQSYEFDIITKDTEIRNLNITLVPMFVNKKLQGIYGICEDITERKKAVEKISSTLEGTIDAIAMMSELRDPYTAGHQKMVTQLALAIAREVGLPDDHMQALRVAGLLHDVGKVYVPSEILSKPGKLSELERGLAKGHATASYDIVKAIKFPWPVCRIIVQHHERLDGSGYPKGLKGEEIIQEARILAVADVVEAMVSHRPYRPALGIDKALEEITQNKGVLYDETAVDACVRLFKEREFQFA